MKNNFTKQNTQKNLIRFMRILLIFVALALYGYSITFDYTLDDALMISKNQFTLKGVNGIKEIFTNDAFAGFFGKEKQLVVGGRYRPLTHAMFAIEYEIFGLNPMVGHLLNVILYAILALLVFETLRLLLSNSSEYNNWIEFIPFTTTLLFIVHPLHSEVVVNIKGRDEIIALIGAMTSLFFSLRYALTNKSSFLVLSFIFFLIGLFSKENSITFIAVIPISLFIFYRSKLKTIIYVIIPILVAAAFFLYVRYLAIGFFMSSPQQTEILNNPFVNSTKTEEIATVFFTWLVYAKLLFFPHPLTHDYYPWHFEILNFSEPIVWFAILMVFILAFFTVKYFFKHQLISYGILFFALTFSIQSNLIFNIGTFMNERFVFTPILGWSLIVAYLFSKLSKNNNRLATISFILLSVAYSIKTFSRSLDWRDNLTLFTTDVRVSNNSAKCNVSAAEALIQAAEKQTDSLKKQQMFLQAYQYTLRAQKIHPTYFGAYDLAGKAAFHLNNYFESFRHYQHCLKINPKAPVALNNIYLVALAAISKNQYDLAEEILGWAISIAPDSLHYQMELAHLYERKNKIYESIKVIESILMRNNNYARAWAKLGELHGRYLKDLNNAERYLQKALLLDSQNVSTIENLGVVYGLRREFDKALQYFIKALELSPNESRIHRNIANTYLQINQVQKAKYHLEIAEKIEHQKK